MSSAFLRIVSGPREGTSVPLSVSEPVVIGRNRGDLLLDDALVSGSHCRIVHRDGQWVIQDLGSTNGTVVDGRLVQETRLSAGSEIGIGSCRLILFLGDADERPNVAGGQLDIAWLLDDELLPPPEGDSPSDIVGQGLRLPPGMTMAVEVVSGPDTGRVYALTRGSISIGRRTGEVALSDVEVSRRHAFIEVFGRDMIFLRDISSTNGTYHNGRRVDLARIQSGDTIMCGKTVLRLSVR